MRVIPFMSQRKSALAFSVFLLVGSVVALVLRGLNFGLDFTGGTLLEVSYADSAPLTEIRSTLQDGGYEGAVVVSFGTDRDVLIRLPGGYTDAEGAVILRRLQSAYEGEIDLRRIEFVGPQVGEELREQGGLAILMALALVMLYIGFRFQFKFGLGAVAALIHDVVLVLGFFAVTGLEFDLTVLAAILAVIGYSLNDTIVVSDRIRENFRKLRKTTPQEVIDISLSEMLGRTLITSLTTLLVLVSLAVLGGAMIKAFAIALIVGVIVGTYSSVYVASNVLLFLKVSKDDLMVPVKEGADQESQLP